MVGHLTRTPCMNIVCVLNMKPPIVVVVLALSAAHILAHPGHDEAPAIVFAAADSTAVGSPSDRLQPGTVSITVEGDYRIIRANGLPDHTTGRFPNHGNPNRIAAQNYSFRVPVNPKPAGKPTPLGMHPFGVAINGVVFDPGAAEWWRDDRSSGWQYEAMSGAVNLGVDQNNAHVQPNGAYHYHAIPTGLMENLTGGKPKIALVGWAADGFPMYGPWGCAETANTNSPITRLKSSYRVKTGERPDGPRGRYDGSFVADYEFVSGAGDLDECNGRTGVTPEFPEGTYYYVLTAEFPFIPRMFKGTPDKSFFRSGPDPGGRRPPNRPPGAPRSTGRRLDPPGHRD